MSFASEALATELRLPVRRWGGNHTSRYNWQNDTSNRGSDWYFENIPEANGAADAFVEQDRRTGAQSMLTVPLVGWVAGRRLEGHPYDCGFKVSRYGPQQSVDPWDTDCGNGLKPDGTPIVGNDPADTSVVATPAFVQGWVEHLVARFGTAAAGGVAYYSLDNEPMLWSSTHRDVHPEPASYDEMRERTIAVAAAVKAADPSARTLGPVVWGWTAYFWSALDWAAGGNWWSHPPDRLAHGDVPFIEWYLQQLAAYERQHGTRLLDLVDVHFYPPGVALASAGDSARQALRLRSTRLLWDRTYSEESWIAQPVYIVPRMREWVQANYPGTGTAVTEYNWGALDHINGALAQADVLGIFGREGLDVAVLWGTPEVDDPGAFAFRMYRNVDGHGGGFGDVSVRATSADQAKLAAYAAQRSADGALTIMVVNKTAEALATTLTLSGVAPTGPVQVWRYGAARLDAIVREADLAAAGSAVSATFPAQSITLLVVPDGTSRTGRIRRRLR
ncbi:MAG: glycoside hydrolase family 44 protein [Thermoanaerobaculaceae bacterium]